MYHDLCLLSESEIGQNIIVTGRLHNTRNSSNNCFVILRKNTHTIQCFINKKKLGDEQFKLFKSIPTESFVAFHGLLSKVPDNVKKIESCSYHFFELIVSKFELISKCMYEPFKINDANDLNEGSNRAKKGDHVLNEVHLNTRLDNRCFDLRAPINNCIIKLQSGVKNGFRQYLLSQNFTEITTPKLISTSSEGGAVVFSCQYFDKRANLAQSPQLYKQIAINSDFDRVFEIGPVFRAENSFTHRHLCEFTGLDIEMAIDYGKNYLQVVNILWNTITFIFDNLKQNYQTEYEYVKQNYKFEEIKYPKNPVIVTFEHGVDLLKNNGFEQDITQDLSTVNEKELGNIVKTLYNTDLFVLINYPIAARPFYTAVNNDNPNFTNSYDFILRGEEICSGAQRIHDYDILIENVKRVGINPESLESYLESFKLGSKPHGGGGFGLERILMLFLDLKNVRRASMFPRDPKRIIP